MTTISLKQDGSLIKLTVNGRLAAFEPRITEISKVSAGRWEGIAGGERFTIIGGRESGGASNEWFCQWDIHGPTFLPATSAAAAIRIIENA